MSEREDVHRAGVPQLLDEYKQRRRAWLAQADELVRLRDLARSAAEREAVEIVTAARRDVKRVIVQARRELLVLTAQLHAAVEAVDDTTRAQAAGMQLPEGETRETMVALGSFQPARDAVLDARREVRSVLDEARAEIEALAADALGPRLAAGPVPDTPSEPVLTLDAILGDVTRSSAQPAERAEAPSLVAIATPSPSPTVGGWTVDRGPQVEAQTADDVVDLPRGAEPSSPSGLELVDAMPVEEAVSLLPSTEASGQFDEFHASERLSGGRGAELESPLLSFGETGPLDLAEPRVFLAGVGEAAGSSSARMWVGLFAATGLLAIAGTLWWLSTRRSAEPLATQASAERAPLEAEAVQAADGSARSTPTPGTRTSVAETALATAPSSAAGLALEVRRTAWIRTVVDGAEESRVYQAGETRQIVGARSVAIRAGDAGAVFVSVDGRPAEALGASGVAATKQYSLQPAAATVATSPAAPSAGSAGLATGISQPPSAAPGAARGVPQPTRPQEGSVMGTLPQPTPASSTAPASTATPTPTTAAGQAPPDTAAALTSGNRADLVAAGQQWLDAYQRRDRDGMASAGTESTSIADERSVSERFPAWQQGVRRELDQVELELTGDTALLTARMVERAGEAPAGSAQHVSRVSQIWVRRNGRWQIADVRIIGEGRLSQIVR